MRNSSAWTVPVLAKSRLAAEILRDRIRLSNRASHIHSDVEPLFSKVTVLQSAPDGRPCLPFAHDGAPADALDLGLEIPGLLRREPLPFHAPNSCDQEMRMPVGALALRIARMGRVHVELNRETLRDEVFDGKAAARARSDRLS